MPATCPECHAPLAADQRYCLGCGHRVLARRLDWRALPAMRRSPVAPDAPAVAGVELPPPRVAATLLLTVMGFGVALANVAASDPAPSRAAARPPLTVLLPEPAPAPPVAPPEEEPPPADPEPVAEPEPAFVAPEPEAAPEPEPEAPAEDEPILAGEEPADAPDVRHVFVVALGSGTYEEWFGDTSAVPYLRELAGSGTLLAGYRSVAGSELANALALVAGQPPIPETEANCPTFCAFTPDDLTLADQLVEGGRTWKAYVEGQDAPGAEPPSCRHPEDGAPDPYAQPGRPGDPYVTWRNPFVYFPSVTSAPECEASDVGLTPLATDLASVDTTATFSYIAPAPENSAPPTAEAWLRVVLPAILGSPAYANDGLVAIVPTGSGDPEDPVTGALLLSEDHVAAGAVDTTPYDHYSTLKSLEELFGLRPLGEAGQRAVESFVSPLLH